MVTLKCGAKNAHFQNKVIDFQAAKNVKNFDLKRIISINRLGQLTCSWIQEKVGQESLIIRPRPWQLVTRSWQLVTRSWKLETRPWQLVTRSWQLVTRSWQLVTKSWQLVTRPNSPDAHASPDLDQQLGSNVLHNDNSVFYWSCLFEWCI